MKANEILLYFSEKYKGDPTLIMDAVVRNKESIDYELAGDIVKNVRNKYITLLDNEYPDELKQIGYCPVLLYYQGDISLLRAKNLHKLAVQGQKSCTNYGIEMNKRIISELPKDYLIISGGEMGQDTISIKESLKQGLKNIVVLPSGFNKLYPESNKELYDEILQNGGLILTEYPENVEPTNNQILQRKRIIAGLCDMLLITEAERGCNAMTTVKYALNYGKDVGCVPYMSGSLCTTLIKEGAALIEDARDIVSILNKEQVSEKKEEQEQG